MRQSDEGVSHAVRSVTGTRARSIHRCQRSLVIHVISILALTFCCCGCDRSRYAVLASELFLRQRQDAWLLLDRRNMRPLKTERPRPPGGAVLVDGVAQLAVIEGRAIVGKDVKGACFVIPARDNQLHLPAVKTCEARQK